MQKKIELKLTYEDGTIRVINSLYGMKHNGMRAIKAEVKGIEYNSKDYHKLRCSMDVRYSKEIILN